MMSYLSVQDSIITIAGNDFAKWKEINALQLNKKNASKRANTGIQNKSRPARSVKSGFMPSTKKTSSLGEICYAISGRNYIRHDSLFFYTFDAVLGSDENILLSGQFVDYSQYPHQIGAFCIKTDTDGELIWGRLFDSTNNVSPDHFVYYKIKELRDGSFLLAGRTNNDISGNTDFVLTRMDISGNIIWTQTYESVFWQGFNGSGDVFGLRGIEEDPLTGDIYFSAYHWANGSAVTKINGANGDIFWSNEYRAYYSDKTFGIVLESDRVLLFQLEYSSYNQSYINVISLSKQDGSRISAKSIFQTGDPNAARMYDTYEVIRLNNGNYRMSGPTTRNFEFPSHTGTVDLFHAAIVELDPELGFIQAYGFKNRMQSNMYNTKLSLFADGTGVFTMLDVHSGFTADAHISIFKDDQIYHQRIREHRNEGVPYEPSVLQLPDGGFLNIKLIGDSTENSVDGSRIDFYRFHSSDTGSSCIGYENNISSVWRFNYEPTERNFPAGAHNVVRKSRQKEYSASDFVTYTEPACPVISYCDTLSLKASINTPVCPGSTIVITTEKNKECGSLIPLEYDTSFVSQVVQLSDTTYEFHFNKPGSGYIYGSLMGCTLKKDSIYIEVIETRYELSLGPDTIICPGNTIVINGGAGFSSYLWQDGSTDSVYTVTAPGTYYLQAINGCGTAYTDTVIVADHPPIPFSIGEDRFKCNEDTIHVIAPAGFIGYTWSPQYQTEYINERELILNPLVDTVYTIVAELTAGCFAYDTIKIRVNQSPPVFLGADTSLCRGDGLQLDAGAGFLSYEWNDAPGSRYFLADLPSMYKVQAMTADGCYSYDSLRILSNHELPVPDLGPDSLICSGQPRILSPVNSYVNYLWNTGSQEAAISVSDPGIYWVSVTDLNGCTGADTTIVPALALPATRFLGTDTAICSYSTMQLRSNTGLHEYVWSNGSRNESIVINQPGIYWLKALDQNNCKVADSITISLKDCMEGLYVPTAFSPNGDGLNDTFKPLLFGNVQYFRFTIFNRWGEIVFQTNTPGAEWDGRYKGSRQDGHVFVWQCEYGLLGQSPVFKKGTVTIVR